MIIHVSLRLTRLIIHDNMQFRSHFNTFYIIWFLIFFEDPFQATTSGSVSAGQRLQGDGELRILVRGKVRGFSMGKTRGKSPDVDETWEKFTMKFIKQRGLNVKRGDREKWCLTIKHGEWSVNNGDLAGNIWGNQQQNGGYTNRQRVLGHTLIIFNHLPGGTRNISFLGRVPNFPMMRSQERKKRKQHGKGRGWKVGPKLLAVGGSRKRNTCWFVASARFISVF